jgi:hypothetical protein
MLCTAKESGDATELSCPQGLCPMTSGAYSDDVMCIARIHKHHESLTLLTISIHLFCSRGLADSISRQKFYIFHVKIHLKGTTPRRRTRLKLSHTPSCGGSKDLGGINSLEALSCLGLAVSQLSQAGSQIYSYVLVPAILRCIKKKDRTRKANLFPSAC